MSTPLPTVPSAPRSALRRAGDTIITGVAFDISREPLRKPIGFKGAQFDEKWITRVTLSSASGARATAYGGLAALWADERVFLAHTETGANLVMAGITEFALQRAKQEPFTSPLELQDRIFEDVHDYACSITRLADLRPTFTLNALVALDHAAWLLHARERRVADFDELIRPDFDGMLRERHRHLGCIPLLSYTTTAEEVGQLVDQGHFVLKVKIGAAGDDQRMLEADKRRLLELYRLVGHRETAQTVDGKIRFYLDANGRYRSRDQVEALLDFADEHGMLPQIALFEEPFDERVEDDVRGLPVMFAADESLHRLEDVAARWEAGYRAIALKPAGKGLTTTLRIAREALRLGAACFVADSACTPLLLDWNKNVAARLSNLPGIKCGVMEVNGPQQYTHWDRMIAAHPQAAQPWIRPEGGAFRRGFLRGWRALSLMSERRHDHGIVLTGLADEAADDVESQIRAHRELGWKSIELRMINGRMLTVDLSDTDFDHALAQLEAAGLEVAGIGSAIGNWSRAIDGDFSIDERELDLAVRRMKRLGTRFVRTMSWTRGAAGESVWRDEAIRRYRILARRAEEAGVVLLHENCAGWGGQSAAHMCEFIEAVGSTHVGILFDIGNTISHGYQPWEFYQGVKGRISYVHVKDCRRNPAGGRSADYAYAGEGHAMVKEILADLLASGYRGTISIEPHIAAVIHLGGKKDPASRFASYLDYARRVEEIIAHAKRPLQDAPA